MIFSAWGTNGYANTFIGGDQLPVLMTKFLSAVLIVDANTFIGGDQLPEWARRREPGIRLVKIFHAASYNDAMRQYHEWQGWEPYKPMRDADGNEYPEDSAPYPE